MAPLGARKRKASYAESVQLASEVESDSEGLVFLPYLAGERTPIMNPSAKAGFVGIALRHGPEHFLKELLSHFVRSSILWVGGGRPLKELE